jgi:glycerol-3-phosphate acyltransferase PlsY
MSCFFFLILMVKLAPGCGRMTANQPEMSLMETFLGGGVTPLTALGVAAGCYLLGCFSTGYYLVRERTGRDIRELGSGSTGARNAGRLLGRSGFVLTMLGDFAKGALAVGGALALTGSERVELLAWVAVVAGHVWPVQLGFRGGKGVSTSLMGLLILDWRLALIYCLVFGAVFAVGRRSVAASLAAFAALPAAAFGLGADPVEICVISVVAGMIILAHHRNVVEGIAEFWSRRVVGPDSEQSFKEL